MVKKTDYDTKVTEIENKLNDHNHDKYITTPEFNTLAADVFNARLAHANLVTQYSNTVSSLNSKIAENKTENESIENEFKKLKTFGLGYFIGKSHFEENGAQNYLVFQPIERYFKIIVNTYASSCQSKGLSDKNIKPPTKSDNTLTPLIDYCCCKVRVQFNKGCLKQPNKLTCNYGRKVNIYIVYELGSSHSNDSDPTLRNCVLGAVTLTKNADIKKYGHFDYGIGFVRRSSFSFPGGGFGQNVLA